MHVESVAWASERKDLLCALFFLLSVLMYTKYAGATLLNPPLEKIDKGEVKTKKPKKGRKQPPPPLLSKGKFSTNSGSSFMAEANTKGVFSKYYLFALVFFILALISKPMAVSLPFVLLILDWYPFRKICSLKTFRTSFTGKLPFFAFSIASSILTLLAQKTEGAIKSMEAISFVITGACGGQVSYRLSMEDAGANKLEPILSIPEECGSSVRRVSFTYYSCDLYHSNIFVFCKETETTIVRLGLLCFDLDPGNWHCTDR